MPAPDRMIIRVCKIFDVYMAGRSWSHNDLGDPSFDMVIKCTQRADESIEELEKRVADKASKLDIEFSY